MNALNATSKLVASWKKAGLAILVATVLALFVSLAAGTAEAHAEAIASMSRDGAATEYEHLEKLADDLQDCEGKTVTIDMNTDWDASGGGDEFDVRLIIPEKCDVTLNMHGHIFDRGNVRDAGDYSANGEVIYVETGATLTINGASNDGEKARTHEVRVFSDVDQESAEGSAVITGGCIAGGNSSGGTGGIYIDSGKTVTLNDVTIAGCKAEDSTNPFVAHSDDGGGVIITESGTKLAMNNSRITGCLASGCGGAIYQINDDDVGIDLNASSIDHNYANESGGGISMNGESIYIAGTNGSSISNNKCKEWGGGVWFWNDEVELRADGLGGLTLDGNQASEGGAVYLQEETNTLRNLVITNNRASGSGGGVYCANDITTIENCTVTGNDKHGVYVEDHCDVDMHVKGVTIIKDNTGGNLTLQDGSSYIAFDQNEQLDVHIGYAELPDSPDGYAITPDVCTDISDHFTADDNGYEVVYSYRDTDQDNGRRLRYIKASDESDERGHRRVNPAIETLTTEMIHGYSAGGEGVYAGGYTGAEGGSGTRYQLRRLYAHHSSSGDRDFELFYTDGFFFDDPVPYNDHLATASFSMATAGAYLGGYGNDYNYKHAGARQFMSDIGCPDQMIYVNDGNIAKPGTDTIGVTIGSKVLQKLKDGGSDKLEDTDYALIAVTVRGANYESEWASNVTLGDGSAHDGEAQGFAEAADQVMDAVEYFIARYGLTDKIAQGKVKFWVSGFSRAGATSNLTSKRLIETYCEESDVSVATGNQVFAYPCEAPKGGTDKAEKLGDKTKYYSIHNIINTGDVVPLVGPAEMGFKRYGVDHYLPGTHIGKTTRDGYAALVKTQTSTPQRASGESGVTSVTTYADNDYLSTKKEMDGTATPSYNAYVVRRDNMVKHLARMNHTMLYTDYFHPYGTKLGSPWYKKRGDFDGAKIEDCLPNFVAFLQQEACYNRDNYAKTPVHVDKDYSTLQEFARAYFSGGEDTERRIRAIMNGLMAIKDGGFRAIWELIMDIGGYYTKSASAQKEQIEVFWDIADEAGAFKDLTAEDIAIVRKYWFTLMDTAFNYTDGDWNLGYQDSPEGVPVYPTGAKWVNGRVGGTVENNLIYTLSLALNIGMIIDQNHDRGVGLAWTRTYDSYYSADPETGAPKDEGAYREYSAHWVDGDYNPDGYTVEAPGAYVKNSGSEGAGTGATLGGQEHQGDESGALGSSLGASGADDNASAANGAQGNRADLAQQADGNGNSGSTEPYKKLKETPEGEDPRYNEVNGDRKVLLEVGEIHDDANPVDIHQGHGDVFGEAIYYDLFDISGGEENPEEVAAGQLYRGGVDLPLEAGGSGGSLSTGSYGQAGGTLGGQGALEDQGNPRGEAGGSKAFPLMAAQIHVGVSSSGDDRGGAGQLTGTGAGGAFKIVAHARSLGQLSDEAVYYVMVGHKVSVDNGSKNDPVVSYYSSGDSVTISAMPADDRFFTHWKVRLLDSDGEVVEEDIAAILLNNKQESAIATFTMPESGAEYKTGESETKKYPDGYGLEVIAVCGDKIKEITPSSTAGGNSIVPVAGEDKRLAETADLSFESGDETRLSPNNPYKVSWTYEFGGKSYATSTEEAIYGQSVYTATIVAPKDEAKSILFASELTASESPEMAGKVASITAERNNADGSATITIVFKPTEDGPEPPAANNRLEFKAVDISNPQNPAEGLGEGGWVRQGQTIEVTVKPWSGYKFVGWAFEADYWDEYVEPAGDARAQDKTIKVTIGQSIPTDHGNLCLYAKYEPVITEMAAVLEAPVGGQPMQMAPTDEAGKETLKIKLKDAWYVVHPDYINTVSGAGGIAWSPQPLLATDSRRANYLTSYTASLHIVPKEEGGVRSIEVRPEGSDTYVSKSAEFLYAEDLKATMNGGTAAFDAKNNTLSYTFPMTKHVLKKVYPPEDVTGIPHGTAGDDLKRHLPLVKILLEGGTTMTTIAAWGDPVKAFDSLDEYSMHVWMANGTVQLPYGVENPNEVSLDVIGKLLVDPAASVKRAAPSVDPGKYLYDQKLTLASETEGATIYWTLDSSATDDLGQIPNDPKWHTYGGLVIALDRADATEDEIGPDGLPTGRKLIRLRAAAFKDGMRPDGVRTYVYVFANEVKVPKGYDHEYDGKRHIGVHGGTFYTLEPISEGITINSDGDAVAIEPGTYEVRAKVKDGFKWEIEDPETGEITYTTEDQVITFTISGEVVARYTITYDLNGGTLDGQTGTVAKVYDAGTVIKLPEPSRDGYSFGYWEGSRHEAGQEYTVEEDHTFTAQWEKEGSPKARCTITYDLNGGTYKGDSSDIVEQYEKGRKIEIHPAPVRDGYEFLYWKGSKYQPGDKYTVVEDHEFVAQWKKATRPSSDPDSDKPDNLKKSGNSKRQITPSAGDSANLMLPLILMLSSALSLVILRRRRFADRSE